jgi:hypothetical protein
VGVLQQVRAGFVDQVICMFVFSHACSSIDARYRGPF